MPRPKLGRSFWFSCFHAEASSCNSNSSTAIVLSSSPSQPLCDDLQHDSDIVKRAQVLTKQEDSTCHEMSSSSEDEEMEMWDLHIHPIKDKSSLPKATSGKSSSMDQDMVASAVTETDDDEEAFATSSQQRQQQLPLMMAMKMTATLLTTVPFKMDIPHDVFHEICHYVFDPITLCHVSCVSKDLHQRLIQDTDSSLNFWKPLYERRWIRSSSSSTTTSSTLTPEEEQGLDWNQLFQERYALEGHVIRTIQRVVEDELEPDGYDFPALQQRSHGRIASTYIESADWKRLIHDSDRLQGDDFYNSVSRNRNDNNNNNNNKTSISNILDVLCATANMEVDYHPKLQSLTCEAPASRWPLFRFVAASAAFTFHCQEVMGHMNKLTERAVQQQVWNPTFVTTVTTQLLNEETAMVLAHALRSIPDVLDRSSSLQQCQRAVSVRLDEIANTVRQYMQCLGNDDDDDEAVGGNDTRTLLQTIHYVLSTEYGIQYHYPVRRRTATTTSTSSHDGDDDDSGCDDMAVHCCSIAHVLLCRDQCQEESLRNGKNCCHPVLVAIIYQAVARRLGLIGDILFCPQNCHSMLRFTSSTTTTTTANTSSSRQRTTSSSSSPSLLFLDLIEDPGRIMIFAQCKELVRRCDLMTEQSFQDRRRHLNIPWPNHIRNDDDDEEDWREEADAFCFQSPMTVQNVVFWLISPFLVSRQDDGLMDTADDDWTEVEEDQPYDFLLGQLVEGNGGSLLSFLQDRLVFFSAIMRHCKLIH